jgi:hypothetical protein
MVDNVRVGDRVRAYDYDCRDTAGENACYVEGIVVEFQNDGNVRNGRYIIQVDLDMWAGKKAHVRVGHKSYPPVNGRVVQPANVFSNRVVVLKPR